MQKQVPTRIVCALDGSPIAERGIAASVRLASALQLPLVLLRSVGLQDVKLALREARSGPTDWVAPTEMDPKLYDKTLAQVRTDAHNYLTAKETEAKIDYSNVSTELVEGSVPFTLMWVVDVDDILVITSRGQGGYKRWSLGSAAEKLIREAPCPVFLERGPQDHKD